MCNHFIFLTVGKHILFQLVIMSGKKENHRKCLGYPTPYSHVDTPSLCWVTGMSLPDEVTGTGAGDDGAVGRVFATSIRT